ncbi:MAG TPA: DUF1289 domain-containing protein [Steroidobacteraceae bacterium]
MPNDSAHRITEGPASPCINVCTLDGAGVCIGCLRTIDEITRWRAMSSEEQWELLRQLARRREQRVGVR